MGLGGKISGFQFCNLKQCKVSDLKIISGIQLHVNAYHFCIVTAFVFLQIYENFTFVLLNSSQCYFNLSRVFKM